MPNHVDALSILSNWNERHGPLWRIRQCDLEWNLSQQDWLRYETVQVDEVPILIATATEAGIQHGVSGKSLWLSLWSHIPLGREKKFLADLTALAIGRGKSRLAIGGDEFHFVAGIPIGNPSGENFKSAVQQAGFQGGEVVDFAGRLEQAAVKSYLSDGIAISQEKNWQFSAVTSEVHERFAKFMSAEFPGRWSREFQFWGSREDTKRGQWFVLTAGSLVSKSEILGFARLAIRSAHMPLDQGWTPGALRLAGTSGFSATDGCLGPIGVAKKMRGQGAGKVLLAHVLQTLRNEKADEICIDWTDAIQYYSSLDFKIIRNFWSCWKSDSLA